MLYLIGHLIIVILQTPLKKNLRKKKKGSQKIPELPLGSRYSEGKSRQKKNKNARYNDVLSEWWNARAKTAERVHCCRAHNRSLQNDAIEYKSDEFGWIRTFRASLTCDETKCYCYYDWCLFIAKLLVFKLLVYYCVFIICVTQCCHLKKIVQIQINDTIISLKFSQFTNHIQNFDIKLSEFTVLDKLAKLKEQRNISLIWLLAPRWPAQGRVLWRLGSPLWASTNRGASFYWTYYHHSATNMVLTMVFLYLYPPSSRKDDDWKFVYK